MQDVSHMKYFYFNKNRFFDGQNETSAVLLAPKSHFAKYHANQGLVLFLTEVVVSTVIMVGRHIPLIGWTFQLLNIVIVVLFFLGLSHAIREVEEPLPFIGEIQILK